MAIPVYLQQFKAAGIYRVVFDKSTVLNQDTQMLRLVVGYSEKGPFNVPVYVKDPQTFKQLFGEPNRKLEKRGIYFHRLALQMLQVSPILCLNLKKFDGETVKGATISTDFNPRFNPIDTVNLNVEDIYDTTRFWDLDESQLNGLRSVEGTVLDQYINICITDTKASSGTYFIRKANGTKVSQYNITVHDWYSDNAQEIPEYLEGHEQNLISDYFAEIYVFKGKFTAKQVLASETLKNYFIITDEEDEDGQKILKLRDKVFDAFGDPVDTLDELYKDSTSGAIGHWVGSLIPDFKNKQGAYAALNVLFNSDADVHNMMMSFNTELLDEGEGTNIDLSGRLAIPTDEAIRDHKVLTTNISLDSILSGEAKTTVLGNQNAPIIADTVKFKTNVYDIETGKVYLEAETNGTTKVYGTYYVSGIVNNSVPEGTEGEAPQSVIYLSQVGDAPGESKITISVDSDKLATVAKKLGVEGTEDIENLESGKGTYFAGEDAFMDENDPLAGPEKVITSISRLEGPYVNGQDVFTDMDENLKVNIMDVEVLTNTEYVNGDAGEQSVYGSSISFIDCGNWSKDQVVLNGTDVWVVKSDNYYEKSLLTVLAPGDNLLASDGTNDFNGDGEINAKDKDNYFDNVYVQETGTKYDENGNFEYHYVSFSAKPFTKQVKGTECLIRIDGSLNREIGTMIPQYLEGYTYKNDRPEGTGMWAKLQWQKFILSALTSYKGLRTGLLNKSEIDYRYVIDTFESFPQSSR